MDIFNDMMLSSPARCQSASSTPSALFTLHSYILPSDDTVFKKLRKTFTKLRFHCVAGAWLRSSYPTYYGYHSHPRIRHYVRSITDQHKSGRSQLVKFRGEEREESEWTTCTFFYLFRWGQGSVAERSGAGFPRLWMARGCHGWCWIWVGVNYL